MAESLLPPPLPPQMGAMALMMSPALTPFATASLPQTARKVILPSFTVALSYISTYIRLIRNNMLENMKQDYVLYANVRGLPQKSILVKHILKNSMRTCIVAMGMSIPQLISGTIVVENVFSWPGLGTLCISSIFNRDYPVIQTYVLLIGVLFVLFNLLFDILQTVSDPRLRKED